ncbi:MAG: hypothetical protein JO288_23330 [Hyphomicrobiales bacterium]|nr:hypothetical protein [Hyphomicrobiales bacterium]
MKRALDLLDEFPDIVEREARPQIAEVTDRDFEGLPLGGGATARQTGAQSLVDNLFERSSGAPGFLLELRRNVVIESKGGPHIMMLGISHHGCQPGCRSDIKALLGPASKAA